MLSVRLSQVLVQHNAVDDGESAVNSIYQEKHNPRYVFRGQHQPAQRKEDDKRNANAPHVAREALRLSFRPEVEDAENHYADDGYNQVRRLNEAFCHPERSEGSIHQRNWYQHRQHIRRCYPINPIHKVDEVRRPHAEEQRHTSNHHLP